MTINNNGKPMQIHEITMDDGSTVYAFSKQQLSDLMQHNVDSMFTSNTLK